MNDAEPGQVIMIIRHGEKPLTEGPPYGITAAGEQHHKALTTAGWARAGALIGLFAPLEGSPLREGLSRPASLFASSTEDGAHLREQETISLLAERLGLAPDLSCAVGEERRLARALRTAPSPALVCWEHKNLPAIITHFGGVTPTPPSSWPADRYDVVWVLRRMSVGYRFVQIPELLLPGDSPDPIT